MSMCFSFQTYVNEKRIPEQEYVILEEQDSVHLGQDDILSATYYTNLHFHMTINDLQHFDSEY